ncbi:hypothetical protein REPUB_Repub13aG0051300 [Reevesia pubescens]
MGKLINMHHLNIRETKLARMPKRMDKLKELRELTDFVIGEENGSRIKELGKLKHLRGRLAISGLQYVVSARDAKDANLKDKKLKNLELIWRKDDRMNVDSTCDREVLEQLEPHTNLEHLVISSYGGCSGVVRVGDEFYGNGTKPFGSLESLCFEDMSEWEEWFCSSDEAFEHAQELRLIRCPKLTKSLPKHLPSLTKLKLESCHALQLQLESLPCGLRESEIRDSKINDSILEQMLQKVADIARANAVPLLIPCVFGNIKLSKNSHFQVYLPRSDKLIAGLISREWSLQSLPSLKRFTISGAKEIESFPDEDMLPSTLTHLRIFRLPNLKVLNDKGFQHLTSLSHLYISSCLRLKPMLEKTLPNSLFYLRISNFPLLRKDYKKGKGKDWPKISHIPVIQNDEEVII